MFKELLNRIAAVLPWGWKQVFPGAAWLVGGPEDHGLKLTAAGIVGTLILICTLKAIVAIGGPIPLTPRVLLGMNLWLAF